MLAIGVTESSSSSGKTFFGLLLLKSSASSDIFSGAPESEQFQKQFTGTIVPVQLFWPALRLREYGFVRHISGAAETEEFHSSNTILLLIVAETEWFRYIRQFVWATKSSTSSDVFWGPDFLFFVWGAFEKEEFRFMIYIFGVR